MPALNIWQCILFSIIVRNIKSFNISYVHPIIKYIKFLTVSFNSTDKDWTKPLAIRSIPMSVWIFILEIQFNELNKA